MPLDGKKQGAAGLAARPFKRRPSGSLLDGRSIEMRHAKATRETLIAGVGGRPTPMQALLIEQASRLSVHILQADNMVRSGVPLPARTLKVHSALQNSLSRIIERLGRLPGRAKRTRKPKETAPPPPPSPPSLQDYLAKHQAKAAEAPT